MHGGRMPECMYRNFFALKGGTTYCRFADGHAKPLFNAGACHRLTPAIGKNTRCWSRTDTTYPSSDKSRCAFPQWNGSLLAPLPVDFHIAAVAEDNVSCA